MTKPVFESVDEYERTVAEVKADPPRPGESFFEYLERISKRAGLVPEKQLPLTERVAMGRVPGEED